VNILVLNLRFLQSVLLRLSKTEEKINISVAGMRIFKLCGALILVQPPCLFESAIIWKAIHIQQLHPYANSSFSYL
jgi:hypothetical protein